MRTRSVPDRPPLPDGFAVDFVSPDIPRSSTDPTTTAAPSSNGESLKRLFAPRDPLTGQPLAMPALAYDSPGAAEATSPSTLPSVDEHFPFFFGEDDGDQDASMTLLARVRSLSPTFGGRRSTGRRVLQKLRGVFTRPGSYDLCDRPLHS
jgi:hypothetical protein